MSDKTVNIMKIEFPAKSVNEGFARSAVSAFAAQCDPSIAIIADIKTVVSEAVTNAIVHAYRDIKDKSKYPVCSKCTYKVKGNRADRLDF